MKKNKMIAAVIALATAICGSSSIISYAEEIATPDELAYDQTMKQLEEVMTLNADEIDYLPEYTYYESQYICNNAHYMVAFNPSSLPSRTVNLYINLNVVTNSPASTSNYVTFYSNVDVDSTNYQYSTNVYKYYRPHVGINGTLPARSKVFAFNMGVVGGADSEAELLTYTCEDPNNPDTTIKTSQNEYLKKCIYAMGDPNRDGRFTSDDSLITMQYIVGNAIPDSNRSVADQDYDEMAFKLAADVDKNGQVDILDVIAMNSALVHNTVLY